eukprot:10676979-Alexandrium_andersonii.AAC.1
MNGNRARIWPRSARAAGHHHAAAPACWRMKLKRRRGAASAGRQEQRGPDVDAERAMRHVHRRP